MRLSNTKTIFLHFSLITSLTLLLKPNANAQTVSSAKVFAYNDDRHNGPLFNDLRDDRIYTGASTDNHDEGLTDAPALPSLNFLRTTETLYLKPLAYHAIKSYPRHVILRQIYSIELKHSGRLTFKPFKLVIVPFWQSK
jgi:hypothetical protein